MIKVDLDDIINTIHIYIKNNKLSDIEIQCCKDIICLLLSTYKYKGW